jgi:hypothetical protein
MKRYGLLIAVLLLAFGAPAFAATNVTMCSPSSITTPGQVQTLTQGTLTPDSRGCIIIDTSKDLLGKDMNSFLRAGWDQQTRAWAMGSTNAVVSNTVESFFPSQGSGTGDVAATIGDASVVVNTPTTIKNLQCSTWTILNAAVAAGGTNYVFALNVNGVDTALTCTELTAATVCTPDTTHAISVAAGSTIEFSVTPTGTPTAAVTKCTAEMDTAN